MGELEATVENYSEGNPLRGGTTYGIGPDKGADSLEGVAYASSLVSKYSRMAEGLLGIAKALGMDGPNTRYGIMEAVLGMYAKEIKADKIAGSLMDYVKKDMRKLYGIAPSMGGDVPYMKDGGIAIDQYSGVPSKALGYGPDRSGASSLYNKSASKSGCSCCRK